MTDSFKKKEEKAIKNYFAKQCLRDIADYDYISARTLFRNKCFDQFLYYAHHCIEKYLKAILLFNDISSIKCRHDLERLLSKATQIKGILFSKRAEEFIKNINRTYYARYLSAPFSAQKQYLLDLDATVWDLRFFCKNKKQLFKLPSEKQKENYLDYSFKANIVFNGKLEEILRKDKPRYKILKENLIWKNFYYGTRRKRTIRFQHGYWSKNPIFFLGDKKQQKKSFNILSKYIKFEKEIMDYFKSL